ncbi:MULTISPECIES: putative metalloprotease CJM1_0395 family protein [unclassified Pseudoalteromonas]|uniref:putative metalloprotease CJM1_0395 family protein n=1 Tax=unclassified Pseudoalteromonas TaxID=194690 RepID=UPI0025B605A7|nr:MULTISPECIES: putative metalloprotease CJM1_0395 family protein [unclassified Pseudoalteromonas]MDN3378581.1 putative metalloprotease CJM1_0395 family protein [Pseudoalteromonas sp. APC 3893]MDN3387007.1 putative metalloprotease CJM1_0395 family protein [Pseudoalteromonas sp. APC 4017]
MNIVTPFPNVNINTANVYTETARRDNQLREVIPPPAATKPSNAENKALGDNDKAKQPATHESVTYDSKGKVADETVVQEREQGEQNPEQQSEEQQKEAKKEQQTAEQEELDAAQITELKARDTEVRVHEQAHASVGGQYAGSPSYEYQRGPDGQNYAVGGEVQIDVAEIEGDPQATIEKMQTVRAAALAPAEPSGADRAIAADATQKLAAAQAELTAPESDDESAKGSGATFKVNNDNEQASSIPNSETATAKRDADVDARAGRIAQFYQAATSPYGQAGFSATI